MQWARGLVLLCWWGAGCPRFPFPPWPLPLARLAPCAFFARPPSSRAGWRGNAGTGKRKGKEREGKGRASRIDVHALPRPCESEADRMRKAEGGRRKEDRGKPGGQADRRASWTRTTRADTALNEGKGTTNPSTALRAIEATPLIKPARPVFFRCLWDVVLNSLHWLFWALARSQNASSYERGLHHLTEHSELRFCRD